MFRGKIIGACASKRHTLASVWKIVPEKNAIVPQKDAILPQKETVVLQKEALVQLLLTGSQYFPCGEVLRETKVSQNLFVPPTG